MTFTQWGTICIKFKNLVHIFFVNAIANKNRIKVFFKFKENLERNHQR